MKEHIHFYYTNDLHSYFEHWPQVVTFLKKKRQESSERQESSWTIDIGDHLDRVHPITEATMGKANVKLLNDASYDLVTVGNNEGITLAHEDFYHLYDEANFDVICSNLQCILSENPSWLHTSKIVESRHGVKIGFIGLTAPFNPYYHLLGWHVDLAHEAIERELIKLKGKTDIILLLSHLGINEDQEIARKYNDIDVIIGGHTHHLLRTGEVVDNTLLTAGGKHCAYVGEVRLTWDHTANKLINKEAYTTNITHLPKDAKTEREIETMNEKVDKILGKKIIRIEEPIQVDWLSETPIIKRLTEKLVEWTNADCGMLNAGLLLDDFAAGDVTYKDVHRICPHPINPCVVYLTGDELLEVIRASLTDQFINFQLKGFGFRGVIIGRMVFAKLDVKTAFHANGQEFVKEVYFNDAPLQPDKKYKLVTADIFTFGRLLPEIAKSEKKDLFLPEFLRDLLVETLKDYGHTR
ncbi:bifunctional UDP-sugar hydrolase/5'-nucleotidase [Pseudogracilibacillus sp. SE30717A]|uniref:bifunctional metallophosphatase/5'-nucleotidase n=1 Tax=Pseudogracilibacillus sp. SE30717A TaxID=3098293 RepID=UPI00300E3E69